MFFVVFIVFWWWGWLVLNRFLCFVRFIRVGFCSTWDWWCRAGWKIFMFLRRSSSVFCRKLSYLWSSWLSMMLTFILKLIRVILQVWRIFKLIGSRLASWKFEIPKESWHFVSRFESFLEVFYCRVCGP